MRIVLCQSCAKHITKAIKNAVKRDKCQCCGKAKLCAVWDLVVDKEG